MRGIPGVLSAMDTLSVILSQGLSRRLLDGLADAVYVVDADCRVVYWNPAAAALTGFAKAGVVGQWCRQTLPPKINECQQVACGDNCPGRRSMIDGEMRYERLHIQHRAGHRIPVHLIALPVHDAGGSIIASICVLSECSLPAAESTARLLRQRLAHHDDVDSAVA